MMTHVGSVSAPKASSRALRRLNTILATAPADLIDADPARRSHAAMALRHALASIASVEELLAQYLALLPAWHSYLTDATFDAGWDRVRHAIAARLADLYPSRHGTPLEGALTAASDTIQAVRDADPAAANGRVLRGGVEVTEALLAGTLFDAVIHVPLRIANELAADPTELELLDHMLLIATVLQLSKKADWTQYEMYLATAGVSIPRVAA